MADQKNPNSFKELMRRIGQTKQFPIDLQPINPMASVKNAAADGAAMSEEKSITEGEAQQRISTPAANLRQTAKSIEGASGQIKTERATEGDGDEE